MRAWLFARICWMQPSDICRWCRTDLYNDGRCRGRCIGRLLGNG